MGDTGGKSLSMKRQKAYAVITEAIEETPGTPSWIWDQLESDGATMESVLSKVDGLSKAQLQKYFPQEEWGNLASMSKEDRKKTIKEKLSDLGVNGAWEGTGQYNPKSGQVDMKSFDPVVTYAQKGGAKKLSSTLDKMSVDELKQTIKDQYLDMHGISKKFKTHRQLKKFIMDTAEARATKGDAFRYHKG